MSSDLWRAGEAVTLKDGTRVLLRPIRPEDAARLQAFHARLSPESIYLRWLSAHPVLSSTEALDLATVDYDGRMAIVASTALDDDPTAPLVGVARYGRVPQPPDEAEVAVVVEDTYQRRGLGTALLRQLLLHARTRGFRYWSAEVSVANARMMKFIQRGGLPIEKRYESGSWLVRVEIAAPPPGETDVAA